MCFYFLFCFQARVLKYNEVVVGLALVYAAIISCRSRLNTHKRGVYHVICFQQTERHHNLMKLNHTTAWLLGSCMRVSGSPTLANPTQVFYLSVCWRGEMEAERGQKGKVSLSGIEKQGFSRQGWEGRGMSVSLCFTARSPSSWGILGGKGHCVTSESDQNPEFTSKITASYHQSPACHRCSCLHL